MKCFYHKDRDAEGVCKACMKGLCGECLVEGSSGIACKNRCEEGVRKINTVVEASHQTLEITGNAYVRNTVFSVLAGVAFLQPQEVELSGYRIIAHSLRGRVEQVPSRSR